MAIGEVSVFIPEDKSYGEVRVRFPIIQHAYSFERVANVILSEASSLEDDDLKETKKEKTSKKSKGSKASPCKNGDVTDARGRTPEEILSGTGHRYLIPYDVSVDEYLCARCHDTRGLQEIERYKGNRMELMRHRSPENWALEVMKLKEGEEKHASEEN